MAISTYVPGMEPDSTRRNAGLTVLYILLLPVLSTLAFVWVPVYVGMDYNGVTEVLSAFPGISPGGGVKSGVVAFVYIILVSLGPRLIPGLV